MSALEKDIEVLRKEAKDKEAEVSKLEALLLAFPDLKKRVGRWNKVAYYSASVNSKVNDVDIRHNCGCCSDSPLEAWPYLDTEHGKVYSDPPDFWVADKDWGLGDRARLGWDSDMRAKGISETVISIISRYLRASEETGYADDDE